MRLTEMNRYTAHLSRYFQQEEGDCIVLHPRNHRKIHIDMLLFKPSRELPFWKLSTMGAGDYKLPLTSSQRNEFLMFLPEDTDLSQAETLTWFCDVLLTVALYPMENHIAVRFGHSIVWGEQPGTDMVCACLQLPSPVSDPGFFKCRLGPFKQVSCLQVVLLTRQETEVLQKLGPEKFLDVLYPAEGPGHFLCEKYRSHRF